MTRPARQRIDIRGNPIPGRSHLPLLVLLPVIAVLIFAAVSAGAIRVAPVPAPVDNVSTISCGSGL